MKKQLLSLLLAVALPAMAETVTVSSPDGRLQLTCNVQGRASYSISYDGKTMLDQSPLGFKADAGDFSENLQFVKADSVGPTTLNYTLSRSKTENASTTYKKLVVTMKNEKGRAFEVEFRVADNDVALRYNLPAWKGEDVPNGQKMSIRIDEEFTAFRFPQFTTTFLSPQSDAMIAWKGTKPSYEEEYKWDAAMTEPSQYGHGYTFPCLFRIGENGWVLVSETDLDSRYCASHLSEVKDGCEYQIAFPMPEENNGNGTVSPAMSLPNSTPWRTLTVGQTLKPIVETTVAWDYVEPRYEASQQYKYGKSTWAWILWQDPSSCYPDLKAFIDLARDLKYPYTLIDAGWDQNPGYEKTEELIRYAKSLGVETFLWYSSSGWWNDITQSPINVMSNPIKRKQDMKWMQSLGVKGIKVDFFGGDKQETIRLYEQILSDANDYGLMVIFHGCTIPRGWERMYPNYVGSEAVLASENLIFQQHFCDEEAKNTATHPFIRNTLGSMEWGGSFLSRTLNRGDDASKGGSKRRTTDAHELAQAVLFQNAIQNFALAPENLDESKVPAISLDFMKSVPTTWKQTRFIDGYPGKFCVLQRLSEEGQWYVAGNNATEANKTIKVQPEGIEKGQKLVVYTDNLKTREPERKEVTYKGKPLEVTMAPQGGFVIVAQ